MSITATELKSNLEKPLMLACGDRGYFYHQKWQGRCKAVQSTSRQSRHGQISVWDSAC